MLEEHRGRGLASRLVRTLLKHVDRRHAASWLSGRVAQRRLYERLGFEVVSDTYDIVGTGPHFDFVRAPRGVSVR